MDGFHEELLRMGIDSARVPCAEECCDTPELPATTEAEPWRVSFSGGFWRNDGAAGREISLDRRFPWDGRDWRAMAVYVCPEGLVIDLAMEVMAAEYRAFLEKWGLTEGEPTEPTAAQRESIERDNPLRVDFRAEIEWNGATLWQKSGCGICWLTADCLPEGMKNEPCAAAILAHYGLDTERCWSLHRQSFPFPDGELAEPQSLTLRLARREERFSAPAFDTPAPGQNVTIPHPLTGESYRLTVTEVAEETLPPSAFPDPTLEYPVHLTAMGYTLAPEHGGFSLSDCAEGDRPRRRASADSGADGPTAVILGGGRSKTRAAVSSLYFDPPTVIRWRPAFREKTVEDAEVALL